MTPNLGVGAGRRPGARFQVDAGQKGAPGDPRLLLNDVEEGQAVSKDADGNPVGISVVSTAQLAYEPDPLVATVATFDANDAPLTGTLRWPDGATGTFTIVRNPTGAVVSYVLTHVKSSVTTTYTQPAITRDGAGRVTSRPAITVS